MDLDVPVDSVASPFEERVPMGPPVTGTDRDEESVVAYEDDIEVHILHVVKALLYISHYYYTGRHRGS